MRKSDSPGPDLKIEFQAQAEGFSPVAGVDEAGRGPWAGPVVAAAVILDPASIPVGLDDSKKLSETKREALFGEIWSTAQIGIGQADVARIDADNILQATLWAMQQALGQLPCRPGLALIDGNRAPKLAIPARTVIKGDGRSLSIAAASIIAKVTRDRLMRDLDAAYPAYGFGRHKGYGTKAHSLALDRHGPCPEHRRSFAPIKRLTGRVAKG